MTRSTLNLPFNRIAGQCRKRGGTCQPRSAHVKLLLCFAAAGALDGPDRNAAPLLQAALNRAGT